MHSSTSFLTCTKDAITFEGLTLGVGSTPILENASGNIHKGQHIVLCGRNGAGKTTFFRWIAETQKMWNVYEVQQDIPHGFSAPLDAVLASDKDADMLRAQLAKSAESEDTDAYVRTAEMLDALGADSAPARARKILNGLGFSDEGMLQRMDTFSGGWRARIALACALFMEPDLLLLDEPTNHLDLEAVLWLGFLLEKWKKTFIVITHNRGFACSVASTVFELSGLKLATYKCGYQRYVQQKTLDETKRDVECVKAEKQIRALRAKGTKHALEAATKIKKDKKGKDKKYIPKIHFETSETASRCSFLVALQNATLGYGDKTILSNVSASIYARDRIVLLGRNGSGKSTLLRAIFPQEGDIPIVQAGTVEKTPGAHMCLFSQDFAHKMPPEMSPLEWLCSLSLKPGHETVTTARKFLGMSGLAGALHTRPIGDLSGGQKARVYMAMVSLQEPNILLLDEPTNHLDMETVDALIASLETFGGAVVVISHDLDFLERVGTIVWTCEDNVLHIHKDMDALDDYAQSVYDTFDE